MNKIKDFNNALLNVGKDGHGNDFGTLITNRLSTMLCNCTFNSFALYLHLKYNILPHFYITAFTATVFLSFAISLHKE